MVLLVTAAACLAADVLLLSAAYKALRPRDYLDAVRSYRRLRVLAPGLRYIAAWATPPAELAVAALALVPATRVYGLAAACAFFMIFYAVVGGDDRPVIANCGCWGRPSLGVSRRALLARNIALACVAGGAFALVRFASTPSAAAIGGNRTFGTLMAAGMVLPAAFLILEAPDLLMIVKLRPADHEPRSAGSHRRGPSTDNPMTHGH